MKEISIFSFMGKFNEIGDICEMLQNNPDYELNIGAQCFVYDKGVALRDEHEDQIGLWDTTVTINKFDPDKFVEVTGNLGVGGGIGAVTLYFNKNLRLISREVGETKATDRYESWLVHLASTSTYEWRIDQFYIDGSEKMEEDFCKAVGLYAALYTQK